MTQSEKCLSNPWNPYLPHTHTHKSTVGCAYDDFQIQRTFLRQKNKVGKNWLRKTTNIHLWPSHAYTCVYPPTHTHKHTKKEVTKYRKWERSHEIQEMGDVAQERGQAMAQESKPTASSEQTCQKTSMLLNISKAPTVLSAKGQHPLTWENLSLLHSEEALTAYLDQHLFYSTEGFCRDPYCWSSQDSTSDNSSHEKLCQTQTRESLCFPGLTCILQWLPGKHSKRRWSQAHQGWQCSCPHPLQVCI